MMASSSPSPVLLCDYAPPAFLVEQVELEFELGETTLVRARLKLTRNPAAAAVPDCVLNGVMLETISLKINGVRCDDDAYAIKSNCLTLFSVPDEFCLETEVRIHPAKNTALSGL